jgi:hypothetical protein
LAQIPATATIDVNKAALNGKAFIHPTANSALVHGTALKTVSGIVATAKASHLAEA